MKIGLGLYSLQRPPDDPRGDADLYAEALRQARLAEDVGLDSIWFSEHHFADDGYIPAILPMAAAVAAQTSRIEIGTGPGIASFYHPLRLAEDIIALDLLSRGRFIPCIGLGYREVEFRGMGIEPESDFPRFREIVDILQMALSGRPFSYSGRYYTIPELRVTPPPYTPGGPRLMLAGDHVQDRDAEFAGQAGARYMLDPALHWDELVRLTAIYDAALPAGTELDLPLFCYGFVAEGCDAWVKMEPGFSYLRRTYDQWQDNPPRAERLNPRDFRLVLGTPAEVEDEIDRYRQQFGDRLHLVLRLNYPGAPAEEVEMAIRLLGSVAGRLRDVPG
ncbi:MAG: LLM class flavin-dependent oxidoreductase [Chloroflexota bacterium]